MAYELQATQNAIITESTDGRRSADGLFHAARSGNRVGGEGEADAQAEAEGTSDGLFHAASASRRG